jgi:hypothetical protein
MEVIIEHVEEAKEKEKYLNDIFGQDLSAESKAEYVSSEFWALIAQEKCYGIGTLAENEDEFLSTARISHFEMKSKELLEADDAVLLYMQIEKFCIQKGYSQIMVRIPDGVKNMSVPMRKFFKKVGFKNWFQEFNYEGKFTVLLKKVVKEV